MATDTQTPQPPPPPKAPEPPKEVRIYGHTALFYWWPVWVIGYLFGLITMLGDGRGVILHKDAVLENGKIALPSGQNPVLPGTLMDDDGKHFRERMHPSKTLGVVFVIVLFVVILITNVPLRGVAAAVFVSSLLVITLSLALLGWWEDILAWFGQISIHLNAGFYFVFSTLLLLAWLIVFYGYDRMSYWLIRPGQITQEYVLGGGQRSFDTDLMVFEKLRDDLFRHWILGLGSGDLIMYPMQTGGAQRQEFHIYNVLFVGAKLRKIQALIAIKPEQER
jgi:hypothetical protein